MTKPEGEVTQCICCRTSLDGSDFYIDGRSGGLRQPCKECLRARSRDRSKTEAAQSYKRAYREANREAFRVYNRDYRARNPGMDTEKTREWSAVNPEKRRAHNLVWKAIYRGDLVQQPCEVCGEYPAHAHHDDYSQPLEVRWLCPSHHATHHALLSQAIRNRSEVKV